MKPRLGRPVGTRITVISSILIALSAFTLLPSFSSSSPPERSYWIWNAHDLSYVEPDAELILYQGDVDTAWRFERRGIQPHPLQHNGPITLLFRLYHLGPAEDIAALYQQFKQDWARRGVAVQGLQIDYDSPSSRLNEYRQWLQELKTTLPGEPLSATTLATYVFDAPEAFSLLAREVDYLAMQLYQGYAPHANYQAVINYLRAKQLPHRVGVTLSPDFPADPALCAQHCAGVSVFLNQLEPNT